MNTDKCKGCGKYVETDDAVWVDSRGRATMKGDPYHAMCAPGDMEGATDDAVRLHKEKGIGTRPRAQWDDKDVIDSGLIFEALSLNGLACTEDNEKLLEDKVSPLVFAAI